MGMELFKDKEQVKAELTLDTLAVEGEADFSGSADALAMSESQVRDIEDLRDID